MLKIHNTLTRTKEVFAPIEPGKVRIYVCGMTVYDYCHLGHARAMVVFDVVVRYLRHIGYDVTYVRNITDIDDKIIQRAAEKGEPFERLTERFIRALHEDSEALGILPPDLEPRATGYLPGIIAMIERLIARGHAYAADNGDVYYDVSSFKDYGKLSGKQIEDLRAGARVDVGEAKDDPLDFTLWKSAKPGEPSWPSPWGEGRPGWHIECSAMSTATLGDHFDIHGGGQDLQFPHHENEIAQSEGATGHPYVNVWMHNGFVRVNEEKMSKSLGNFFTIREILEKYRAEEIRYFILTSHYRSPLNYSTEQLDHARAALTRFYTALRGIDAAPAAGDTDFHARFTAAMDDDFNTPEALSVLFDLVREINRCRDEAPAETARLAGVLVELGGVLGVLQCDPDAWLKGGPERTVMVASPGRYEVKGHPATLTYHMSESTIEELIKQRNDARAEKNWGLADQIRDQLSKEGIVLEDGPQGTTWRRE
ncbi:MAG: cysteine--tRNA ligase [Proteobacteria bacterium]|nr:MAG: cysteine--tRNA ligase [Pseudomonadota bacterium]